MKKAYCTMSGVIFITLIISGMAGAFEISAGNVSGKPGEILVVPVNISNAGTGLNIDAFSFIMQFDSNILSFDETTGIDKSGTLIESFTLVKDKTLETGKVKINGALFGNPLLASNGLFLKIKFSATSQGTSQLKLSGFIDDVKAGTTNDATISVISEEVKYVGDIDHSGKIDLKDAVLTLKVLARLEGYAVYKDADTNGNGKIGLEEAIYILQYISE